jgi:hypothetical protein
LGRDTFVVFEELSGRLRCRLRHGRVEHRQHQAHSGDGRPRIIPGHCPELIKQPDGQFGWTEGAAFDLIVH